MSAMPPVITGMDPEAETEEQRRNRLARPMPPLRPVESSPGPATREPLPAVPLPTGHPADAAALRSPANPTPSAMPPVKLGPSDLAPTIKAPMANAPAVQPGAMPSVPVGPQQKAYEDLSAQGQPKLSGWKKALDVIGSIFPLGRTIETAIPGSPQNYDARLNNAALRAAKEQTLGEGARRAETESAQAQFNTPEKRRTYMAEHPDEFEGVSDFQKNDFILAGKFPQREAASPTAKIAYHYTNDEGKEVSVFEDGTEKVGGAAQGKPDKLDKKIDEFVDPKNNRVNVMQRPDGSTYNVVRGQSRSEAGVGSPSDVRDIANGIVAGIDPPDMTKYGYRDRTAIAAELKRQGFDLSRADQDWHATQKHLATLNGAQQERLRQAVSFTDDSLHILDGLYSQWQKIGLTSGWKVFNKASLATAKQFPGEAGNLAHRLEAQISDLTSELGTVYKGGNSSTDESLKLAAKNLEADWNEKTFKDAINQIRQNLEIRKNSIRHSQAAGVSENSPYTPKSETERPQDYGPAPQGKAEGSTGTMKVDGKDVKIKIQAGRIVAQ